MREITEKEVKLKQQLLESPAHQKVKGELHFSARRRANVTPSRKGCATSATCSLFVLFFYSQERGESPAPHRLALWQLRGKGHGSSLPSFLWQVGGRWEALGSPRGRGGCSGSRHVASRGQRVGRHRLLPEAPWEQVEQGLME